MNSLIIGLLIVGAVVIWKFGIQPIMNEDKPIEPGEEEELNLFEALD